MRKTIIFLLTFTLIGAVAGQLTVEAESSLYAEAVYSAGLQTYRPNNSLDAPDQVYTDFLEKDAFITLDLGENGGLGNLTFYYKLLNYGARYRLELKDADLTILQTTSNIFPLSESELTIAYTDSTPYRYVTVTSTEEETWSLDASMAAASQTTEEEEEAGEAEEAEENQETSEAETTPLPATETETPACGGNQGLLVKREDDGNAETVADSVVYVIGCNETVHVFPNEKIYKTWWTNFDDLSYVDNAWLASQSLEENVTVRPGTYLVKIPSSPKVYAVEPGGLLRWIPDEATALALYGANWNKIIMDIPNELFSDYTIGENLTTAAYPNGVVGYLPEGRVVYLSDNSYYNLPGEIISSMRFNSSLFVPLSANIMAAYTDGGDLAYDKEVAFPF
jgi:hypothetical protein